MTERTYAQVTADIEKSSQQIWHLSEQLNIMLSSNEAELAAVGTESYTEEKLVELEAELALAEDFYEACNHELARICGSWAA